MQRKRLKNVDRLETLTRENAKNINDLSENMTRGMDQGFNRIAEKIETLIDTLVEKETKTQDNPGGNHM